jgi:hypothetical protein
MKVGEGVKRKRIDEGNFTPKNSKNCKQKTKKLVLLIEVTPIFLLERSSRENSNIGWEHHPPMGRPGPHVPVDRNPVRVVKGAAGNGSTAGHEFRRPGYGCAASLTELGLYPAAALVRAVFVRLERAAYEFYLVSFKIDSNTKGASGFKLTKPTVARCSYKRISFHAVPNRATKTAAFVYFIHSTYSILGFTLMIIQKTFT